MVTSRGSIPAAFESALTTQRMIIQPTATLSVAFLAYGTYLTLFLTSLSILARKRRNLCSSASSRYSPKAHLTQIILLFVATTITNGVYVVWTARDMLISFDAFKNASYDDYRERMRGGGARVVLQIIFVVSAVILNAIVDFILITRCYFIWNNSKRVAIPLMVVSILVNRTFLEFLAPRSVYPVAKSLSLSVGQLLESLQFLSTAWTLARGPIVQYGARK
ncbi:hypothetical protein PM082_017478 [Marasmius tenuissimus]|nr:hypothetical protein PM082_017478 [Marasmius tenuissimus]